MKFRTPATREEKPHCGIVLVPFMKRTTSLAPTMSAMRVFVSVLMSDPRFA